jgi:GT2 family glycosyltransferase
MKPITFCIASANNEKEYTKLLLKSLREHTKLDTHEILVFIDSDNQNTHEALVELQKEMPMMKICKNPNDWPIGSQRNVSVMFNEASNDIVCYLQSDMVVGKDFDKHISENLIDNNTVLSCARIEPPLHPESPEKIVKDFGIVPEEFQYDNFNKFVDELQAENRPNMVGHFAPFAIYKSTWYDKLGGFDTQFRCSREDSDMIIRMELWGLNMIQSWNACVYHFTCVSSRGKDWFKQNDDANYKNILQQHADLQELKRFIRKWGFFGHHPKSVYDITFNVEVDHFVDMSVLKWLEPYCKKLYLTDSSVSYQLASQLTYEASYYSNLRLKYSPERWNEVKHLFNPTDFHRKIVSSEKPLTGDVVVSFKYSDLLKDKKVQHFIENIHEIVDSNEEGEFAWGPFVIDIKHKNNLMDRYKRVNSIDSLLNEQKFNFS